MNRTAWCGCFALALLGCKDSRLEQVSVPATEARRAEPTAKRTTTNVAAGIETIGDFQIVELTPAGGPVCDQLRQRREAARGRVFIAETTAEWCRPCKSFTKYLRDPAMTKALAGVTLARIDFDRFSGELAGCGLSTVGVPFFAIFDDQLHPIDMISSSEWDDDVPTNMAPVLAAFAHGTLTHRREPWHPARPE